MPGQARPDQSAITGRRGRTPEAGEPEHQRLRGHQPRPLIQIDANRIGQEPVGLLHRAARTSYARRPAPDPA
jgi:hypothetical protein